MRDPDWLVKARAEGRVTERGCGVIIAPPRIDCTEKEFQANVTKLAESLGWEWYHTHDSRRSPEGFPDLVLVRDRPPARLMFVELKTEVGTTSAEQKRWLGLLRSVAGIEVAEWRPSMWREIEKSLR